MENKKAQMFNAILWVVGIILVILYFCINSFGGSIGQHTGIITAVEHNNNLIFDANLVYFKTSDQSTQEDIYCVNDGAIAEKLEGYAKSKQQVTIHFKNNFLFWRWDCNGGISIIENVEVIK